ncbi:MAG: HEAT repeat domain-containing protein, partial [Planctomycetota bacterium]
MSRSPRRRAAVRLVPAARHGARLALALAATAGLAAMGVATAPASAQVVEEQGPQPSEELLQLVEDYYFTATISRHDVAERFGQQIIDSSPEPEALLEAFLQVHDRRNDPLTGLDERLNNFQNRPEIAEVSGELVEIINDGRQARATRLSFIQFQVERLGRGANAYSNGVANLRLSGEFATPVMLSYLQDPDERDLHPSIRRALVDLGLRMVSPLMAATKATDPELQVEVITALGDLGYPEAIPYILEQAEANPGGQVAQASMIALGKLNSQPGADAAEEYLALGEKFWDRQTAITPDDRFDGANIWRWENGNLAATTVPAEIFDELMAMQTAGQTLSLGEQGGAAGTVQDDALALWLASNYRREVELPEGATDTTRPSDDPSAGYYGTQAGVNYLQAVLARVIDDRSLPPDSRYDTSAVATETIRSLREVVGQSSFQAEASPLTQALNFPDRRVGIEAAMAIAQALPIAAVNGGEQVVPLLAEALVRDGKPTVLLVMNDEDELNATAEDLTSAGYRVEATTDGPDAIQRGGRLPGVDVVVIDERLGRTTVNNLVN